MLDIIFILLFVFAVLMLLVSIEYEASGHKYWNMVGIFLAAGLFLILSVGCMEIETAYQAFNSSSGQVETGYHVYTGMPWISYLFVGCAIVAIIYMVTLVFEPLIEVFKKMKRWR